MSVGADGHVALAAGATIALRLALTTGTILEFEGADGVPAARISASEAGLALSMGVGELERRMVLGPKGLVVDGDVLVTGKVIQG